jgi:four helix bundle protein
VAGITSHRDLIVWQKAMLVAEYAYGYSRLFPREEVYGLSSQLRRAAVSVAANIAEGYYRSTREYLHFLSVAKGSAMEVDTLLLLAIRLGHLSEQQVQPTLELIEEVSKMITAICKRLDG